LDKYLGYIKCFGVRYEVDMTRNKRKSDKVSPPQGDKEVKRRVNMASGLQGLQDHTSVGTNSSLIPPTTPHYSYANMNSPAIINPMGQLVSPPTYPYIPQYVNMNQGSPGLQPTQNLTQNNSQENSVLQSVLTRLDNIDRKLGQLNTIQ
jgi:hypothetical protein